MTGVDNSLAKREERKAKRRLAEATRANRNREQCQELATIVTLESSSSDTSPSNSDMEGSAGGFLTPKRGRKNILTSNVLSSFDKIKTSDRDAVRTIAAVIDASGQKIQDFNINRSSLQRFGFRSINRSRRAQDLKSSFKASKPLTIHWDGKLMNDLTGEEKVDRLPIIVSGSGIDQLLSIPKLSAGTGQAMAYAMFEAS